MLPKARVTITITLDVDVSALEALGYEGAQGLEECEDDDCNGCAYCDATGHTAPLRIEDIIK